MTKFNWNVTATVFHAFRLQVFLLISAAAFGVFAGEVEIGGTRIDIPVPRGFIDAGEELPVVMKWFEKFCPPSNRLLCVFIPARDAEAAQNNEIDGFSEYYLVQTYRAAEAAEVTAEDFKQLRDSLRNQFNAKQKDTSHKWEELLDKTLRENSNSELKNLNVIPLGLNFENPNAISGLILIKSKRRTAKGTEQAIQASTANTCLVKGKVLYLYSYARFRKKSDVERVKKMDQALYQSIVNANRR